MFVTENISEIRSVRWQDQSSTWGLVPTMGALHDGHISLLKRAKRENDKIGVSIFINPIQFNNPADLATYPHTLEKDLEILTREKVDLVWTPKASDIYPPDFQTYLDVENISRPLEGAARPGHFKGVVTIVAILFNVFQPQRAYFGEKDAQQLQVIRQMIDDLRFNLKIVACPTVRELDGLAVSSRNRNLSIEGRKEAVCLFKALMTADAAVKEGERRSAQLKKLMQDVIKTYSLARIEYISVADPKTLTEVHTVSGKSLVSLAVLIENVRLIDNISIAPADI